jgi:hypothetical protein
MQNFNKYIYINIKKLTSNFACQFLYQDLVTDTNINGVQIIYAHTDKTIKTFIILFYSTINIIIKCKCSVMLCI